MTAPGPPELMLPGEVAALYRVDAKSVGRWGSQGRLECFVTPGGHKRFFAVEVRALLAGEDPEAARKLALAEKARLTGGLP